MNQTLTDGQVMLLIVIATCALVVVWVAIGRKREEGEE